MRTLIPSIAICLLAVACTNEFSVSFTPEVAEPAEADPIDPDGGCC